MANEYFKLTQIFQKFRKGLKQYPFSFGEFASLVPGSNEVVIGVGIVPDGISIYQDRGVPRDVDEGTSPEISFNNHIDPPFLYDESLKTGLREMA